MADAFDPYAYMRERGVPEHIALAFMDNFVAESGLNPTINEIAPLVEGSRGGRGYYQLTGPRRDVFEERYGTEYGGKDQIDHMLWELNNTEKKARDAIYGTDNREDAAMAITKTFLRPAVVKDRAGLWDPDKTYGVGPTLARANAGLDLNTRTPEGAGVGDDEPSFYQDEYADNWAGRFKKKSDTMRAGLGEKMGMNAKQMDGLGGGLAALGQQLMRGGYG